MSESSATHAASLPVPHSFVPEASQSTPHVPALHTAVVPAGPAGQASSQLPQFFTSELRSAQPPGQATSEPEQVPPPPLDDPDPAPPPLLLAFVPLLPPPFELPPAPLDPAPPLELPVPPVALHVPFPDAHASESSEAVPA